MIKRLSMAATSVVSQGVVRAVAAAVNLGRFGLRDASPAPRTTSTTSDGIAFRALLEAGSDATFLRDLTTKSSQGGMIGLAAQRLMGLGADGLCGAGHVGRTEERTSQRNGCRDRDQGWSRCLSFAAPGPVPGVYEPAGVLCAQPNAPIIVCEKPNESTWDFWHGHAHPRRIFKALLQKIVR